MTTPTAPVADANAVGWHFDNTYTQMPHPRSLAVVTTGEAVYRELPRRGAILTRVAASHIRVDTFEYAAAFHDEPVVRALADYAIARHYPELADAPRKYLEFFRAAADRQA